MFEGRGAINIPPMKIYFGKADNQNSPESYKTEMYFVLHTEKVESPSPLVFLQLR